MHHYCCYCSVSVLLSLSITTATIIILFIVYTYWLSKDSINLFAIHVGVFVNLKVLVTSTEQVYSG